VCIERGLVEGKQLRAKGLGFRITSSSDALRVPKVPRDESPYLPSPYSAEGQSGFLGGGRLGEVYSE
jgi:hypothetical protein